MTGSVIVPLSQSYKAHGAEFSSVSLRAPKLKDLMAVGEPYEIQIIKGDRIVIEHLDRLDAYLSRLAVLPTAESLSELELSDAMKVKEAVSDFFSEARKALSPSPTSFSSSSGAA